MYRGDIEIVMQKKSTCSSGFTLVEIMIVVALIGLLAQISVPNLLKARATSQAGTCVNNLRQLDLAKAQWALEFDKNPSSSSPTGLDLQPYLGHSRIGTLPHCPLATRDASFDLSYTPNSLGTPPLCKFNNTTVTNHLLDPIHY